jgi:signal transduction histidine kinase
MKSVESCVNNGVAFAHILILARKVLGVAAMSSFESLYKKMASLEQRAKENSPEPQRNDPARHISPSVAHGLNNLLTVIQIHAERLLLQDGTDPALAPHFKAITDAAKRAATIINDARSAQPNGAVQIKSLVTATNHAAISQ